MQYLRKSAAIILILLGICANCLAQDMKDYEDHWEGRIHSNNLFSLKLTFQKLSASKGILTLSNKQNAIKKEIKLIDHNDFEIRLDSVMFSAHWDQQHNQIQAFIRSGQWLYHATLTKSATNTYSGAWNILLADRIAPEFYLSIENGTGNTYEAYAFLRDNRFSGFACYDFQKEGNLLRFGDFRTGLQFTGILFKDSIALKVKVATLPITTIVLHRSTTDWDLKGKVNKQAYRYLEPAKLNDGITVGNIKLAGFKEQYLDRMVDSINANKITNTHSVLIARKGKLIYEQYFNGYDRSIPHDLRSASKSITSAIMGIAINKGILKDSSQKIVDLLPQNYGTIVRADNRKAAISIGNLLTMSSGIDAVDFGIERVSLASEDKYQNSADWLKTVLNAPMINWPGTHANYGSANPYLLGIALNNKITKAKLEFFMDKYLLAPLGISDYIIQTDNIHQPYMAGGMYLRPRDLLKFGLLYSNQGNWKGKQLISKEWVKASFGKYLILENHNEKNEYGYLWWHYSYTINGQQITSIEARGAGGQYIFIIPKYDLVVVVTSGNFRNGRVWQPEKIMENYILPAVQ